MYIYVCANEDAYKFVFHKRFIAPFINPKNTPDILPKKCSVTFYSPGNQKHRHGEKVVFFECDCFFKY